MKISFDAVEKIDFNWFYNITFKHPFERSLNLEENIFFYKKYSCKLNFWKICNETVENIWHRQIKQRRLEASEISVNIADRKNRYQMRTTDRRCVQGWDIKQRFQLSIYLAKQCMHQLPLLSRLNHQKHFSPVHLLPNFVISHVSNSQENRYYVLSFKPNQKAILSTH